MGLTNEVIKSLPSQPGVYLFWQGNEVIYIGKANNLRARISSHFQNSKYDSKEKLIIDKSDRLDFKITQGDFEATLFEAELIKKYQPKYNVRWKDDKNFLYIKITIKDKYPKILTTRKENDGHSLYFGPFSSTRVVNNLLREIRRVVPFCSQKKLTKKPCFYSKIGLCNPCPNYILSLSEKRKKIISLQKLYRSNIKKIVNLLKGNFAPVFNSLEKELKTKIKKEEYEDCLKLRNKIQLLQELIYKKSFINEEITENKKNWQEEVNQLLIKFRLIKKSIFIKRIECFDISHLFGQQATGSMVVFIDGVPEKKEYKRFKIKAVNQISDVEMLKEVLQRRFLKKDWPFPQLLIIDGGKPQATTTLKVLKEFNLKIPVIGIVKSPDRLIIGDKILRTIKLPHNSSFFNLLKYIRDESHRFAKKYHLLLRKKTMML